MTYLQAVTDFVRNFFVTFSISTYDYFYTFDPDTEEEVPKELFPGGIVDTSVLDRLSVEFGVSKKDIAEMNTAPLKSYCAKYPFFHLYQNYQCEWNRQSKYKNTITEKDYLLAIIFDEESKLASQKRYDSKIIQKRLVEQLKEMDALIPGTYHKGATINDLRIETEGIISFPQITDMLRSFLQMIDDAKELFFKGLREELPEEEIHLFNFLCSTLRIYDFVAPTVRMNYNTLKSYKDMYISEGMSDFFSYVKIKAFVNTHPWRCKEFFDDEDLVQQLVNCFPYTKNQLREFVMSSSNFYCTFHWSDAKQIELDPGNEECYDALGLDINNRPLEWTRIYIPKTDEEMFDWVPYIHRLKKATSPETKGGLAAPKNEWMIKGLHPISRCMTRITARGDSK